MVSLMMSSRCRLRNTSRSWHRNTRSVSEQYGTRSASPRRPCHRIQGYKGPASLNLLDSPGSSRPRRGKVMHATRSRWCLCSFVALVLASGIGWAQFSQSSQMSLIHSSKQNIYFRHVPNDLGRVGWPFVWYRGVPTITRERGYDVFLDRLVWDVLWWLSALAAVCYITLRASATFTVVGILIAIASLMITFNIGVSTNRYLTVPLPWLCGVCVFCVVFSVLEIALRAGGRQCWLVHHVE